MLPTRGLHVSPESLQRRHCGLLEPTHRDLHVIRIQLSYTGLKAFAQCQILQTAVLTEVTADQRAPAHSMAGQKMTTSAGPISALNECLASPNAM